MPSSIHLPCNPPSSSLSSPLLITPSRPLCSPPVAKETAVYSAAVHLLTLSFYYLRVRFLIRKTKGVKAKSESPSNTPKIGLLVGPSPAPSRLGPKCSQWKPESEPKSQDARTSPAIWVGTAHVRVPLKGPRMVCVSSPRQPRQGAKNQSIRERMAHNGAGREDLTPCCGPADPEPQSSAYLL